MIKIIFSSLMLFLGACLVQAAKPDGVSSLPAPVQRTINAAKGKGQVRQVTTLNIDGKTIYQVVYKERGEETQILIAPDGSVVGDEQTIKGPKGRSKDKGKKGKGGGDDDGAEDAPVRAEPGTKGSQVIAVQPTPVQPPPPVVAPVQTPTAPPATTQPAVVPQPPAVQPAVVQPTAAQPPAAQPAVVPVRTQADLKAEMNRRVHIINTLDDRPRAAEAGLATVARETGVPLKTIQTQRSTHPVGTAGLLIANELAKATGKPAGTFLKQRLQKRDWDAIIAEQKGDVAAMFPKLDRLEQAMAAAIRTASAPKTTPATVKTVSTTGGAQADVKAELNRRVNIINTLDDRPRALQAGMAAVAAETGVPLKTIQTQRGTHNVGTAGLLVANELAKATGKPAGTFLKQRLQNRQWDAIAADQKVEIATLFPKLDRVEQAMAAALK
jgi:hypothetical protein